MKKRIFSALLALVMVLAMAPAMATMASAASTPTIVTDGLEANMELQDNTIYIVTKPTHLNPTENQNGLRVAKGANTVLYIAQDAWLTVSGYRATNNTMGGKAGILLPEGSTLTITGQGRLIVYGGDGYAASNGGDGKAGKGLVAGEGFNDLSSVTFWGGAGGNGGLDGTDAPDGKHESNVAINETRWNTNWEVGSYGGGGKGTANGDGATGSGGNGAFGLYNEKNNDFKYRLYNDKQSTGGNGGANGTEAKSNSDTYKIVTTAKVNNVNGTTAPESVQPPVAYHTFKLEKTGGAGGISDAYVVFGTNETTDLAVPTRTGYNFLGYFTKKKQRNAGIWKVRESRGCTQAVQGQRSFEQLHTVCTVGPDHIHRELL